MAKAETRVKGDFEMDLDGHKYLFKDVELNVRLVADLKWVQRQTRNDPFDYEIDEDSVEVLESDVDCWGSVFRDGVELLGDDYIKFEEDYCDYSESVIESDFDYMGNLDYSNIDWDIE